MFRRCLEALLRQRMSRLDVHLVIVDNSFEGREQPLVASCQIGSPIPITYVHEPTPGIPNARNCALDALQPLAPDWVAFIDDDEIAPADWISRLHAAALNCGADVASGQLTQFETAEEAQAAAENWKPNPSFGKPRRKPTCPTSNVIFRGSLVTGASGLRFDESMQYGGSDVELFMRAHLGGAQIFAVRDAPVFEEYPRARKTWVCHCMRAFRVGATTNYRYRKNYGDVRGVALLAQQTVAKTGKALANIGQSLFFCPFARSRAERKLREGVRHALTAFGIVGPAFGIRPRRYW